MSEEVTATTPETPSKGKQFIEKLNAYRNIILAVAALATAIGSWLKPTDTTATKQSFDWTSKKVEELSKNQVQMHDDIVAIRGFLDGYVKAQAAQEAQAKEETTAPPPPPPLFEHKVRKPRISGKASGFGNGGLGATSHTVESVADAIRAFEPEPAQAVIEPELPDISPDPKPVTRPSFEEVTK